MNNRFSSKHEMEISKKSFKCSHVTNNEKSDRRHQNTLRMAIVCMTLCILARIFCDTVGGDGTAEG